MGKKLLSDDCNRIVLQSFNQPDEDFSDYYQNKIDENIINDERIIEKLKLAVNRWIELYKDYVSKFTVGTNWDEKAKAWEIVAEKDRYTNKLFLPPEWGLIRKVDLAFFENHLRIIEDIERQRNFKKLEIESYILERIKTNIDNLKDNPKPDAIPFIPKTDKLNEWILSDYISKFTEIEIELFNRGFIDASYKWQKSKTDLVYYICVLKEYRYFRPRVNGKTIKDFHKKQFISERYGYDKTGLSEAWKKANRQIENAVIPFYWIKKPE